MKKHLNYEIIGQTLDDAVGEAFDKVARILGLGYPGGPAIAARAANHKLQITRLDSQRTLIDARRAKYKKKRALLFPRPMINSENFDFSFSGLKTAVLYETKKHPRLLKNKKYIEEICHEFQQAAIDVLVSKTIRAAQKYNPRTIMIAGGVSANLELRKQLGHAIMKELSSKVSFVVPDLGYSLDNAAMVAVAGYFRWKSKKKQRELLNSWKDLPADANLKLA
jgi:N6-L-threonylcarbamoyladenine synthase